MASSRCAGEGRRTPECYDREFLMLAGDLPGYVGGMEHEGRVSRTCGGHVSIGLPADIQ